MERRSRCGVDVIVKSVTAGTAVSSARPKSPRWRSWLSDPDRPQRRQQQTARRGQARPRGRHRPVDPSASRRGGRPARIPERPLRIL